MDTLGAGLIILSLTVLGYSELQKLKACVKGTASVGIMEAMFAFVAILVVGTLTVRAWGG